jgi:squalene cyclase
LKLQDEGTVKRVALVYPTQQTRDTAFIEMDRLVRAYEAAQAVREDDDL